MEEQQNTLDYENIFIAIIKYIRNNPRCKRTDCTIAVQNKFNITKVADAFFVNLTISKVSMESPGDGDSVLIINPDALFYLMEYQELKHSLKESKAARKQAIISTWFAVAGLFISIVGLVISIYYSNKQIELSERQLNSTPIQSIEKRTK
jgi:hypothetical protein